jgi:hypothetical protein
LKTQNIKNRELFDWYCFTDGQFLENKESMNNKNYRGWKMIMKPYHEQTYKNDEFKKYKNHYLNIKDDKIMNMMKAKYYKIKTHEIDILKDYDYFFWIDGSVYLRNNFVENIMKIINNKDKPQLINFKHSARNNIKDETKYSNTYQRYRQQHINLQYEYYKSKKFPDKVGLFELTIIFKKNNDRINKIFDKWWIHNLEHSFQDQLSYPYVLWESNDKPDYIINENVFDNDKFSFWEKHIKK